MVMVVIRLRDDNVVDEMMRPMVWCHRYATLMISMLTMMMVMLMMAQRVMCHKSVTRVRFNDDDDGDDNDDDGDTEVLRSAALIWVGDDDGGDANYDDDDTNDLVAQVDGKLLDCEDDGDDNDDDDTIICL